MVGGVPHPLRTACALALWLTQSAFCDTFPLKTCADLRALPPAEAEREMPVLVRATVTFSLPGPFGALSVQDETAGIYVDRNYSRTHDLIAPNAPWPDDLPPGTRVEIRGVTWRGHFAPVLCPREITILGSGPLPEPTALSAAEVLDGRWDSQRVRLRGVVQYASNNEDHPEHGRLDLVSHGGRIPVYSKEPLANPLALVDSEVEATGVAFTFFNNRGELVGMHLKVTDDSDLAVLRRGSVDPFSAPIAPLSALRSFSPFGAPFHRTACSGVVTLCRPGQFFYMQTEGRGVRVETHDAAALVPGDRVEASGFVELTEHFGKLREAVIRQTGHTQRPAPAELRRSEILGTGPRGDITNAKDTDGVFARVRGTLEELDTLNTGGARLFIESEGRPVTATLVRDVPPASLSKLQPGSELEIDGVVQVELTSGWPAQEYPSPASFHLLVNNADDIKVERPAPWWTPARLWLLLAGIGMLLAGTLVWNGLLRRRVDLRSTQLASEMRARREAAVAFGATLRERERLAADIHDSLEQLLTSVALQLEAGDALRVEAPARSASHLHAARQLLSRSREEVRRSVWNLRAQAMDGRSLAQALQDVATAAGQNPASPAITVQSEGCARPVSDLIAGNLLLLAQESLTNAIKHSRAANIALTLLFSEETLTVRIEDDGCGFDPANRPGPREGHFGLQGMRERMKRLGGSLEISDLPEGGTRIEAQVKV